MKERTWSPCLWAAKEDSVPIPEEVMARALPDGTIRLTWFFDEALLRSDEDSLCFTSSFLEIHA